MRVRFNDYIRELEDEEGRDSIQKFFQEFINIHYCYTIIKSEEDRIKLEDLLIKTIDPPANKLGRIIGNITQPEEIWEEL